MERMPALEGALSSGRQLKARSATPAAALRRESERVAALTQDDPKAYCEKNPKAGCCKFVVPIMNECDQYFNGDVDPNKLCPSSCATKLRDLAKQLKDSGERDGVCVDAIKGVALVDLICAKGTDSGYCFEEVGTVGMLLNETDPAPMKVNAAVGALCDTSGSTDGTCFQQITDGQNEIYGLMAELITTSGPWGDSDDAYPYDDDASKGGQDDDAGPANPLQLAIPTLRGLDMFCNRIEVAPLSPKSPFCLVHLIENTTVFHANDDQPTPDHIIQQLADPCARSFFATIPGTDPVAVSVGAYGDGKRQTDNALCGLVTGFGEIARNLTDYCASEEGGQSTVFNVLIPAGQQPTCSPQCADAVKDALGSLECCGQETLFETWYLGANPAGSIPTQVRPPMDAWIYRISQTCDIGLDAFQHTCGYGEPGTVTAVDAVFTNSKAGYLSLNETESQEFTSRLTVHVARTVGAPAGACKAAMPPKKDPQDP